MTIIENIWILTSIIIIIFVLLTDPKTPTGGSGNNQLSMLFSNVSDGQKSLQTFIWFVIICFYILSILISYY